MHDHMHDHMATEGVPMDYPIGSQCERFMLPSAAKVHTRTSGTAMCGDVVVATSRFTPLRMPVVVL